MGELHDIDALPPGPFARSGGTWLCVFCESARDNPQWFCQRCQPYKPRLDADALEEPVNPFALEAERQLIAAFGERAVGWENATGAGPNHKKERE